MPALVLSWLPPRRRQDKVERFRPGGQLMLDDAINETALVNLPSRRPSAATATVQVLDLLRRGEPSPKVAARVVVEKPPVLIESLGDSEGPRPAFRLRPRRAALRLRVLACFDV